MSNNLLNLETIIPSAEFEVAQIHMQLQQLYMALYRHTDNEIVITVRAAIRGITNELEQAQSEFKYLRDTLAINQTTISEVVEMSKGVQE